MRTYEGGATRSNQEGKLRFEAFLHPAVLVRYAQYMEKHTLQEDGERREADNWQKGMAIEDYMDSMVRHVIHLWLLHRDWDGYEDDELEELLCAIMFNAMGYLFEWLSSDLRMEEDATAVSDMCDASDTPDGSGEIEDPFSGNIPF